MVAACRPPLDRFIPAISFLMRPDARTASLTPRRWMPNPPSAVAATVPVAPPSPDLRKSLPYTVRPLRALTPHQRNQLDDPPFDQRKTSTRAAFVILVS